MRWKNCGLIIAPVRCVHWKMRKISRVNIGWKTVEQAVMINNRTKKGTYGIRYPGAGHSKKELGDSKEMWAQVNQKKRTEITHSGCDPKVMEVKIGSQTAGESRSLLESYRWVWGNRGDNDIRGIVCRLRDRRWTKRRAGNRSCGHESRNKKVAPVSGSEWAVRDRPERAWLV